MAFNKTFIIFCAGHFSLGFATEGTNPEVSPALPSSTSSWVDVAELMKEEDIQKKFNNASSSVDSLLSSPKNNEPLHMEEPLRPLPDEKKSQTIDIEQEAPVKEEPKMIENEIMKLKAQPFVGARLPAPVVRLPQTENNLSIMGNFEDAANPAELVFYLHLI